jgi:hypothetical protein
MGVFPTGTEKAGFKGFSLLRVRMGEKIGARLRLISLNLSIGGKTPLFHIGSEESEVKIVRIRLRVVKMENENYQKSHYL